MNFSGAQHYSRGHRLDRFISEGDLFIVTKNKVNIHKIKYILWHEPVINLIYGNNSSTYFKVWNMSLSNSQMLENSIINAERNILYRRKSSSCQIWIFEILTSLIYSRISLILLLISTFTVNLIKNLISGFGMFMKETCWSTSKW